MLKAIVIALILFLLASFVINNNIIAWITAFIIVIKLLKSLFTKKERPLIRQKLIIGGIYVLMIILILTANSINNRIAKSRAELLIMSCKKYNQKNGEYPNELIELVPEFINSIPPAKYILTFNKFDYSSREGKHSLSYVAYPPFGRPTYLFEDSKWIYLD